MPRHDSSKTPSAVRKTPKGTIVGKTAPVEHTASSKAALEWLGRHWGVTKQAVQRRALEDAARGAGWPGVMPEGDGAGVSEQ